MEVKMKKSILLIVGLFFMINFYAIRITGRLTNVTVYNDRALLSKTVTVILKKGHFDLYMNNISPSISTDTIRVDVNSNDIKLNEVSYKEIFLKQEANPKVKLYKDKIKNIKITIDKLKNRNTALNNQLTTLKSIKAELEEISAKSFTRSSLNIDNLSKSLSFILTKYTDTLNAINDNKRSINKYEDKIDYYNKLLSKLVSQNKVDRRIYLSGYAKAAKSFTFNIKYIAYSASWKPLYRVYLSSNKKNIKMEYYAKVSQRTGEDWKNVQLILSTSMPNYGLKAPVITPQFLKNITYRTNHMYDSMTRPKGRNKSLMTAGKEGIALGAAPVAPKIVENAYTVEYRTKSKYTVLSDNTPKKVYLQTQKITGNTIYSVVPRLDTKVYAQIKSINKSIAPILSGHVAVYYGQSYVGEYYLKKVLPGEKFSMDLGPVSFFKVKFKLLTRKYTPPTIISKKKKYFFKYQMSINNISNNNYQILVYDRIPVSQDSKILIKNVNILPKGYEINNDTGIIKWKLQIKSKQKIEGNTSYEVICPKKYRLNI